MKGRSSHIYYILRGITMAPSVWNLIGFGLAFSLIWIMTKHHRKSFWTSQRSSQKAQYLEPHYGFNASCVKATTFRRSALLSLCKMQSVWTSLGGGLEVSLVFHVQRINLKLRWYIYHGSALEGSTCHVRWLRDAESIVKCQNQTECYILRSSCEACMWFCNAVSRIQNKYKTRERGYLRMTDVSHVEVS